MIGCFLGLLVSLYLAGIQIKNAMGQMMNIPIAINPWDFVLFILLAVVLSILAGYYPAYKASRLDPVAALKG